MAGALAGVCLLVQLPDGGGEGSAALGVALALGSALGYAVMTLCGRTLAGRYHPLQPLTLAVGVGALALLPAALATGLTLSYPPLGWALLLYLGVGPTALAYALFLLGMRSTTAVGASVVTLVEPLTAAVLAWLLFGERLGPLGLVGAALLLGAVILLTSGKTERG
jgi:DME family drug/metabolite transporter